MIIYECGSATESVAMFTGGGIARVGADYSGYRGNRQRVKRGMGVEEGKVGRGESRKGVWTGGFVGEGSKWGRGKA